MKTVMDRQKTLPGLLLIACAGLLAACASAPEPPPAVAAAPASAPAPVVDPCPGYSETADGIVALEAALAEARATGRRVLVIFGANHCPWCRALCNEMELPEIAAAVDRGFVVLKIDIGYGDRNAALQHRIGTVAPSMPHFVVLDANEKILVSQTSADFEAKGSGKIAHIPELLLDFFRAWTGPPAPPPPS
jgi:hypothetical protein